MVFTLLSEAKPQRVDMTKNQTIKFNWKVDLVKSVTVDPPTINPLNLSGHYKEELNIQNMFDPNVKLGKQENIPLNYTMFSFPPMLTTSKGRDVHIPRYMMEYFAENSQHARRLPEGATIARSFIVHYIGKIILFIKFSHSISA